MILQITEIRRKGNVSFKEWTLLVGALIFWILCVFFFFTKSLPQYDEVGLASILKCVEVLRVKSELLEEEEEFCQSKS